MRQLLRRLQYLLHRTRLEDELAEEMAFHRSMSGAAAFGSSALARNQSRDVWIWPWLQDIAQDVRFAARLMAKDRRVTLTAVLTLALGIGATTTVFTFINTALFKDPPFDEPRQIVALGSRDARGRDVPVSYADFQDWRRAATAFAAMSATARSAMNVSEADLPAERLRGWYVSANTFDMLRVKPVLGRGFVAADEQPGAAPVVLIAYDVWWRRYGADASVIGRQVRINGTPSVVIGVMPPEFRFPLTAQAWQPLTLMPALATAKRDARTLGVTARLAPGIETAQARSELTAIAEHLAGEYPETNQGITATIAPPLEHMRRFVRPMLATMLGAVVFVLLIACANVAALLLARAASRAREIAVRASLGATRRRIVRQLLLESLVLAILAGAAGLVFSMWGVRYFGVAFDTIEIGAPDQSIAPYWVDLAMDRRVFAFVAALCLGSSVVFGLAPALHISKTNLNDVLKDAGRSAAGGVRVRRWTAALMIGELALALILLNGAGLLVRSFLVHYNAPLVIDPHGLTVARTELPQVEYPTPEARKAFVETLNERLAAPRESAHAVVAGDIPLVPLFGPSRTLTIDGRPPAANDKPPRVSHVYVGDGYFDVLGLHVIQGRPFTSADGAVGHEAAIVSQRFAATFFPDESPLGQRIRLAPTNGQDLAPAWMTIVGVTPTVPETAIREADPPIVYLPLRGEAAPGRSISVIVRSDASVGAIANWLREHMRALDPDLPLYYVQPLTTLVAQTRYSLRMIGSLFGLLAVIGVVLTSVGLFALTARGVAERTQEIGVRMALGAQAGQVVWLFLRRTLVQLALGLLFGLGGALSVGRLIESSLVRTSPRDPLTLTAICVLLVVVALSAALIPARRAARVDPVVALRHE
jgi:putative ABC transport system permease protein